MDSYEFLELIGEGSFGRVFKGRLKGQPASENNLIALKLVPKVGQSEKDIKSLRRECKIQKQLNHKNIVKVFVMAISTRGLF